MKTTVKKLISTLLVFVMLLSAAPLGGFSDFELPEIPWAELFTPKAKAATSGTCGDNLTWTLDDEGTLTISGTGKMTNYSTSSSNRSPWYYNTSIKKVVIQDGVTSIGSCAFYNCSSLTEITIPEGVTSIGSSAFEDCSSLTEITIPEGVTSIGSWAFSGCASLTEITIPEGVTSISSSAFRGCSKLTEITIPEGVTSIDSGAFEGCSSLTEITLPESVTSIRSYAFRDCSSLTGITIPEGVTSIGYSAFEGCSSLTEITIPEGVTTSIGEYTFYRCSSLTEITIPEGVTSFGNYAFYECSALTDVYYAGSEEQWNAITIDTNNEPLLNANIHFGGGIENDNIVASGTCGNNLTWTLDNEGTLTISGTGEMTNYSSSSSNRSPWYNNTSIKNIIIQNGVTSIGDSAFEGCSSLTEITIPEGVTSIGDYAFYNCSSLTEITIPEGVTSIGEVAFCGCSSLTEITIPEGVTSIGGDAFFACSSLTEITLPEGVTSIGSYAFSDCSSLKKVNITDLEAWCKISFSNSTSNPLCNGAELYLNGEKVTKLTIPDTVTEIKDYAFCGCSSLTEITLPEGVTSIGISAFSGCSSLTEITIPEGVTSIGNSAFEFCSSLTEITIPEGVTTSIGEYMFSGCISLTEITIPEEVTSIGDFAFFECSSLTDVYYAGSEEQWNTITIGTNNEPLLNANIHFGGGIENDNIVASGTCGENLTWTLDNEGTLIISGTGRMTNYSSSSSPWYNNTDIKKVIIQDGVTSIGNSAFYGCSSLTEITIPEGVTYIGQYAFSGCSSLTEITIPEGVTSISSGAFYGCSSLTEITIPEGVTSIGDLAFSGCNSLTEITIPEGVTSIGWYTFCNCRSLTEITIPEGVTSIGDHAFYGCSSLTKITIPEGVTSFGDYAFRDCSSLTKITIPEGVPSVGEYMFYGCSSLTKITLSEGVTFIGDYAFGSCSSLAEITIPESVTSIGSSAFNGCSSLTEINIPEGVTSIGSSAFSSCISLSEITILNPTCEIYDETYTIYYGTTIYGYTGSTAEAYAIKYDRKFVPLDVHTHSYTAKVTLPATCATTGVMTYTCECKDSYTEDIPVDLNNHTGETEVRGFVSFSCLTGGYTGDTYCLACNTKLADGEATPASGNHTYEYKTMTEVIEIKGNNKIDLVFVVDTTGSMGSYISAMKEGMKSYLSQLEAKNIDYRIAIVDYRDFASRADTTDYPYKVQLAFTGNENSVITAINRLVLGNGGDTNETVYSALIDGLDELTWRKDAGKTVILMGDADALDPEPNTGYTLMDVVESLQNDYSSPVTLFSICAKGSTISTFATLATQTGGKCYTSAASLDVSEFVSDIIEVIEKTVIIPDSEWVQTKEPTCTEPGEESRTCTVCGDVQTRTVRALGHDFVVTTEADATCTESGYVLYTCSRCDLEKTENIAPYGHDFGSDNICDRCGFGTSSEHKHSYTATIVSPTCTGMGYTEYSCDCGDIYRSDYIEQKGHSWNDGVVTKEKTCTEAGILLKTCTDCSATRNDIIPASHEWSEAVTKEATCTEDGAKICTCTVCGETSSEVIPAGHKWTVQTVTKEATCTEPGKETRTCSVCGISQDFDTPVLGHNFVDGICTRCGIGFIDIITKDYANPEYGMYFAIDDIVSDYGPSLVNEYGLLLDYNEGAKFDKVAIYLTQDGTMWRRCIACTGTDITNATYVPYLAYNAEILYTGLNSVGINTFRLSKNSSGIWEYSNYATIGVNLEDAYGNLLLSLYDIGQAGAKTRIFDDLDEMKAWLLEDCEAHTEEIIPGVEPTCEGVGYTSGIKCSDCGEILVEPEEIPPTGHNWDSGKITLEPTCTETGEKVYTCQNNSSHIYTDDVPVTDHKWDDGTISKNPTCTETGTRLYKCIYDNSHTKTEDIEILPHTQTLIKGYPATCTETGLTDGVKCSVCGFVITEQEVIPLAEHTPETVKGYPSTCTKKGLTDEVKCSVCGFVIQEQKTLPLAEHTEETINGKAPSCTKPGLSDGTKCSVCGKILVAQTTLPLADHTPKKVNEEAPQVGVPGYTGDIVCGVCGKLLEYGEEIPALNPADACDHLCHKDGFMGFIWKIINFFQKLFGINPVCECGERHY